MNKKDLIYEYETYWKSIVETDEGKIIKPELYKILHSYNDLLEKLVICYSLMTNGRVKDPYASINCIKSIFKQEYERIDEFRTELEDE